MKNSSTIRKSLRVDEFQLASCSITALLILEDTGATESVTGSRH